MDSSELHRKLLYSGYNDVTDYLNDSPVNRFIYKQMLDLMPKHHIEVPVLKLFNEIYYQCVRVQSDGNPGGDLSYRYLDEEETWLGRDSSHANMLVFCYVDVLVSRKVHPSFEEECFLKQLAPLIDGCEFIPAANDLRKYMVDNGINSPYKFRPMPCNLKDIPMRIDLEYRMSETVTDKLRKSLALPEESSPIDFNPWRKVTDNFSTRAIVFYVRLYNKREDQMRLVERIELACTKQERKEREEFFTKLRLYIRSGGYVNNSISYGHILRDFIYGATGEWQNDKEMKRLKDERNELRRQVDDLQKSFKSEKERLEAKYKAEIAELKQRNAEADIIEEKKRDGSNTEKKEFVLTVSDAL